MFLTLKLIAFLLIYPAWAAPGKSHCQMYVRYCVQTLWGHKYDQYHKATADASARAWMKSPYYVNPKRGSVPSDICYWFGTPGNPAGHVAIRVTSNKYAENSTVHYPGAHFGKGWRDVRNVRPPDMLVRIPGRYVF